MTSPVGLSVMSMLPEVGRVESQLLALEHFDAGLTHGVAQ